MKNTLTIRYSTKKRFPKQRKWLLKMCLICVCTGQIAPLSAQSPLPKQQNLMEQRVVLTRTEDQTVKSLLTILSTIDGVNLAYNQRDLDLEQLIPAFKNSNPTVKEILDSLSQNSGTTYQQTGKQIIIKKKELSNEKATISGLIKDAATGEPLIGVTIRLIDTPTTGTVSNVYGYYSLTLPSGNHSISFSYMGFETKTLDLVLDGDKSISVEMVENISELDAVIVSDKRQDANVTAVRMGTETLNMKQIQSIPVLFGEVDLVKVIKLLPGVQMTGETSSGFSVRGGNFDQNLILLDEAVVYNPSHLLGLFSTFNNDAIKNVNFYKGVFPSRYGGRVSSVVDVRMRDGNNKEFSAKGGVSIISSRLTIEAPIVKDKGSIILSGRRTYADVVYGLVNPDQKGTSLYFYDFNGKANYMINEKNKVYISSYAGRDVLSLDEGTESPEFNWGNITTTARWNHIYGSRLFSNLSLIYSKYDYKLGYGSNDLSFSWKSKLKDYSAKMDFEYNLNDKNAFEFGFISTLHTIRPGLVTINSDELTGE
ncbi:MAG: carboxypeptidase-like regulatory domain-containing protein, partial [Cyclobacteriaceae bacterium]